MRALVPLLLLTACDVDYERETATEDADRPSWADEDWDRPTESAWYFRTRGEIGPASDGVAGGDGTVDGTVSGYEEWRIEDEDGVPACVVTWRTDGATLGQGDCPGCTEAWGVLCHSGVLDPGCDQFFDPSYVEMAAELDVGFAETEDGWGSVYMRDRGGFEGWDHVASGWVEGDRVSYEKRYRWY